MKSKTQKGTIARRNELINKKTELEGQIAITIDQAAATALRADYRAVINELNEFYDDIPEGQ